MLADLARDSTCAVQTCQLLAQNGSSTRAANNSTKKAEFPTLKNSSKLETKSVQKSIQHTFIDHFSFHFLFGKSPGASCSARWLLATKAPQMSGSKMDDHISSVALNRAALRWAVKFLRGHGCFVPWRPTFWLDFLNGKNHPIVVFEIFFVLKETQTNICFPKFVLIMRCWD